MKYREKQKLVLKNKASEMKNHSVEVIADSTVQKKKNQ